MRDKVRMIIIESTDHNRAIDFGDTTDRIMALVEEEKSGSNWREVLAQQVADDELIAELQAENERLSEFCREGDFNQVHIIKDLEATQAKLVEALKRLDRAGSHSVNPSCKFTGCNCKPQGEIGDAHMQATEALKNVGEPKHIVTELKRKPGTISKATGAEE